MSTESARESAIEAYLVKKVKIVNGVAFKFNSMCHRGVADRLCLFPNGKMVFVELKTKNGVQSPLQKRFEKQVTELGQEYWLLRSKRDVDDFIEEMIAIDEARF